MPDYSNLSTKLTPGEYTWIAILTRRPKGYGKQPSHDCSGTYTPPPGATVGSFQEGIKTWYAQNHGIPAEEVLLVRISLAKK
jgi:hypothetical protein